MRFLIGGLGSIGLRHLGNLQELGQEDIVLLRSGESTLPESDLQAVSAYPSESDLDQALSRWRPDAVIVSNPTAHHLDVAIPAARAGCHILIEKPISNSLERIDELREAIAARGVYVLIGFQFRFHPLMQSLRKMINSGVLGRTISARAHWGEYLPDWHPWEDYRRSYSARAELGGGVILTLCHPLDYVPWMLGDVRSVSAQATNSGSLDIEVEDTAEIILELDGGQLASVYLDYNQRPTQHSLTVIGTEGTAILNVLEGKLSFWTAGSGKWQHEKVPDGFERNDMFLDEVKHFLQLEGGVADVGCTLEQGVRALQIALAARDAASLGNKVLL